MTQEQIETLIELSAPLVDSPLPWSQLSAEQREAFRWLMPEPGVGFDEDQRFYLNRWWLPVTPEQVGELNSLMPPNSRVAPRLDGDGNQWLCADLLSDAADDGRLAALWPILSELPLTYRTPEMWPVEDDEEI